MSGGRLDPALLDPRDAEERRWEIGVLIGPCDQEDAEWLADLVFDVVQGRLGAVVSTTRAAAVSVLDEPREEVTERERSDAGQRIETGHDEPVASRSVTSPPEQETGGDQRSPVADTFTDAMEKLNALAVLGERARTQRLRAVAAEARAGRYRDALTDELVMWEQTREQLVDLHKNYDRYLDELCDDNVEPYIKWVLGSLIEDTDTTDARAALAGPDQDGGREQKEDGGGTAAHSGGES